MLSAGLKSFLEIVRIHFFHPFFEVLLQTLVHFLKVILLLSKFLSKILEFGVLVLLVVTQKAHRYLVVLEGFTHEVEVSARLFVESQKVVFSNVNSVRGGYRDKIAIEVKGPLQQGHGVCNAQRITPAVQRMVLQVSLDSFLHIPGWNLFLTPFLNNLLDFIVSDVNLERFLLKSYLVLAQSKFLIFDFLQTLGEGALYAFELSPELCLLIQHLNNFFLNQVHDFSCHLVQTVPSLLPHDSDRLIQLLICSLLLNL